MHDAIPPPPPAVPRVSIVPELTPDTVRFEPWERLMLLDRALEDVPPRRAQRVLPAFTRAAFIVVRQIMGKATRGEAYFAVEVARVAIEQARRP